uniref:UBA domain-containing protein n=2 Tax=Aplanochytrium stocchinoi TaxID=215587 RepID=A0A7S3UYG9_9STRA|mmetsp:Transcript_29468/g.36403  ORF Transcript_29468/g.36403 Transcript_29468/m.36403 type:complete len:374 (-) Transcript_29468:870-1991(-)|eukprot:CAMPEP_0204823842 /NCGR_PEP_ID=MMETSP1346-20131115/1908_1 /ASSEMBLY_ACC=CAM_ASM_000771 /TAXON_ID=215587 /ORGANISM="Aplanochytrium stocchinoi, Strain GSBS06" /LENGTH=373 /DNA_ID=CAMNT_0051950665 /DNA_START=125 /DNA_END=1246 /DNA_ORIENTATION=-
MGNSDSSDSTPGSSERRRKVDDLRRMGFEENPAIYALEQSNYDVEQAVAYLIEQNQAQTLVSESTTVRTSPYITNQNNRTQNRQASTISRSRAAEAAIRRRENDSRNYKKHSSTSQPKPKLKPQATTGTDNQDLKDSLRNRAQVLARTPKALDAILFLIRAIEKNPADVKFRTLNVENKMFKSTIATSPAGLEYLKLIGFQGEEFRGARPRHFVLKSKSTDLARLWMGKAVLEKEKEGLIYATAQEQMRFQNALQQSLKSANEEEQKRRAEYKEKLSKEPEAKAGIAVIKVFLGNDIQHSRRFFCDDTLMSVVQWLGTLSSVIPDKLLLSEWDLVDVSLYPGKHIPVCDNLGSTLQSLQWFPSGQIEIRAHKQ